MINGDCCGHNICITHRVSTYFVRQVCPEQYAKLEVLMASQTQKSFIDSLRSCSFRLTTHPSDSVLEAIISDIQHQFYHATGVMIMTNTLDDNAMAALNVPEGYIWYVLNATVPAPEVMKIIKHVTMGWCIESWL